MELQSRRPFFATFNSRTPAPSLPGAVRQAIFRRHALGVRQKAGQIMTLELSDGERSMLDGGQGEALQFAMNVVVRAAQVMGAPFLIDASFVHVDACHYYGQAHVDFAQYLVDRGAQFKIPAWTNTLPINLRGPDVRDDEDLQFKTQSRKLAQLYLKLGAKPVWTCAPYQLPGGPGFGDQIVGSESNAVAFYNSAVGARTNKYGDFLDVCAGLVGRVPFAGLHTDSGRCGTVLLTLEDIPQAMLKEDVFHHVLGYVMGVEVGSGVPVIEGLSDDTSNDQLKAISAAGAASGGVGLFHAVGVTPEAPTTQAAFQNGSPSRTLSVTPAMIARARDALSTTEPGPLNMVAVGTPHFSFTEFEKLTPLMAGRKVNGDVAFYVSTSRHVYELSRAEGWIDILKTSGVQVVVDTCTYFHPAVRRCRGRVMTNSAKWAYYAPGMLPIEVAFGSLSECAESAIRGDVWRDPTLWCDAAWDGP